MELTTEEKQRIEEEERRRAAEEQYRAQVRTEFQSKSSTPPTTLAPAKKRLPVRTVAKALLIILLAFIAWSVASRLLTRSSVLHPFSQPLMPAQIVVSPMRTTYWMFKVSETATNTRVTGNFHAQGGMGDDIEVVVAESGQCENWMKGHPAQLLYRSGKTTNGTLDVPIPQPGTYCLAFNNSMSLVSSKTVVGDVALRYLIP